MTDTQQDQDEDRAQQAYAVLFVDDLNTNKQLASDWQAALDTASGDSIPTSQKLLFLDNFLNDEGYDTTAEDVLDLVKNQPSWWVDYENQRNPNADSDRFVQAILQDADLYQRYGAALDQASAMNPPSLDPVNQFLSANGYNCNADQVTASFNKMRDKNLNYWTGMYGLTTVEQGGGTPQPGPALVVYGDTHVGVGSSQLLEFTYADGVLSWDIQTSTGLPNPCSGKITFSQISQPLTTDAFVGNEFNGTLTYPPTAVGQWKGTYSYSGKIGPIPPNSPGHINAPSDLARKSGTIDQVFKYINYVVISGFFIQTLAAGVSAGVDLVKWVQRKAFGDKKTKLDESRGEVKDVKESPIESGNNFSESTTIEQLKAQKEGTPDPEKQKELDEQIKETETKEAAEEEAEAEAPKEGGGWKRDLEDLAEDA